MKPASDAPSNRAIPPQKRGSFSASGADLVAAHACSCGWPSTVYVMGVGSRCDACAEAMGAVIADGGWVGT